MTNEEMAVELRKAGWRVQEPLTKENCQHPRKQGSGMIGSDGSCKVSWYCPECHDSFKFESGPSLQQQQMFLCR